MSLIATAKTLEAHLLCDHHINLFVVLTAPLRHAPLCMLSCNFCLLGVLKGNQIQNSSQVFNNDKSYIIIYWC